MSSSISPEPGRMVGLDQFRGYTVLGMFVVNFVGSFAATNLVLGHHHTYLAYADTIMPQFFFAVGFAYRLTFLRRQEREGTAAAVAKAIRRSLGLILLGIVWYVAEGGPSLPREWAKATGEAFGNTLYAHWKRDALQTLTHIGITSLWVLPVIAAGVWVRVAFMAGSVGLHIYLSASFNHVWAWTSPNGIDGGPLGFLTWTVPTLVGSLAYDACRKGGETSGAAARLILWSVPLMGIGYAMSCLGGKPLEEGHPWTAALVEPPFVPPAEKRLTEEKVQGLVFDQQKGHQVWGEVTVRPPSMWAMCLRAATSSYLVFAAGFSLAVYGFFALIWGSPRWVGWLWDVALAVGLAAVGALAGLDWIDKSAGTLFPGNTSLLDPTTNKPGQLGVWLVSLGAVVLFVACVWGRWGSRVFDLLGRHPLSGYLIHDVVGNAVGKYVPRDAPLWYVLSALTIYLLITIFFVRYLDKHKLYLRL